jgi:hypothetical protein
VGSNVGVVVVGASVVGAGIVVVSGSVVVSASDVVGVSVVDVGSVVLGRSVVGMVIVGSVVGSLTVVVVVVLRGRRRVVVVVLVTGVVVVAPSSVVVVVVVVGVGHSSNGRGLQTRRITSLSIIGFVPSGAFAMIRTFRLPGFLPFSFVGTPKSVYDSLHVVPLRFRGISMTAASGPRTSIESSAGTGERVATFGSRWTSRRTCKSERVAARPRVHGSPSTQRTTALPFTDSVPFSMPATSSSA